MFRKLAMNSVCFDRKRPCDAVSIGYVHAAQHPLRCSCWSREWSFESRMLSNGSRALSRLVAPFCCLLCLRCRRYCADTSTVSVCVWRAETVPCVLRVCPEDSKFCSSRRHKLFWSFDIWGPCARLASIPTTVEPAMSTHRITVHAAASFRLTAEAERTYSPNLFRPFPGTV